MLCEGGFSLMATEENYVIGCFRLWNSRISAFSVAPWENLAGRSSLLLRNLNYWQ
jgi:hypothetical protein